MADEIMGVICIFLLAFIQIASAKPNQCIEAKDSCYIPITGATATCYLNGQVVDKTSCYQKVCRNTVLVDEYDCPTGFLSHASGICYHVGHTPLSYKEGSSYCEKFGGQFYSKLNFTAAELPAGTEKVPICSTTCKAKGCTYEGKHFSYGEVVWEDPDCRCTRLVCNTKGEVHLEQKEKPCCVYDGVPYGSGETVYTGDCNQLICRNGTLISIPYCPPGYTILTYNGVASCYHISTSAMVYDDADEYCKSVGGNLAQVTSSNENTALKTELFFNLLPTGCKYGWLGATASVDSFGYLDHFQWSYGKVKGIPVEGIYEDFCAGEPPVKSEHDQFLSIVYTGSSDDNNYCWTSNDGFEKKAAICEKCVVCEHIYRKSCSYNDKIYQEGQIVQSVDYAPGPCFTKTCHDGRVLRKDKVCKYDKPQ